MKEIYHFTNFFQPLDHSNSENTRSLSSFLDKTISEMSFSPKIVGQNKKICNLLDRKFFLNICSFLALSKFF